MKAKRLLFAVVAIAATFTLGSCKKDNSPSSSFSYNSQNYETPYAFGSGESDGTAAYTNVSFFSFTPGAVTATSKVSTAFIEFGVYPLAAGTYTFKSFDDATFDPTKNFAGADFGIGMNVTDGSQDESTGTQLSEDDVTAGTITVAKSGDVWTFTYNITYKTGVVNGKYSGKVTGL